MAEKRVSIEADDLRRILLRLDRILVASREIMDGGGLRGPSNLAYDINQVARSLRLEFGWMAERVQRPAKQDMEESTDK
jgi:hypothetical protein